MVRIVVPQNAGGGTDTFARAIGQKLSERWGQSVVVENKAGAGGVVGTDFVAKSPPDGYTLLVTYEGSQAINQSLYEKLPFDSLKDFETIATIAVTPFLLIVGPRVEAKSLKEFIAYAKANPDKMTFGSAGNGSVNHLLGEMLKTDADIKLVHVPYKGAPAAIGDVMGGHIDAAFASMPSVISSVQSGVVRALAVSSAKRVAVAPDVPSIAESGFPDFDVNPWWGILAPAGLDPAIAKKINSDVSEILKTPDMQEILSKQGATPLISSADQFRKMLARDIEKWRKVVKASGATVN
ncbi:MAG: tripartite tricarboxylate transporter substrate binding protein [Bradyrhizobium icense]|nr:MAG: tripartite tricarboxylate transporter substrate binding protein [Bradyrhizobium icense]